MLCPALFSLVMVTSTIVTAHLDILLITSKFASTFQLPLRVLVDCLLYFDGPPNRYSTDYK